MIFNPGKSKLVIDLDSCEGIYIKKNGEECTLEDYIYKLVLLAIIRQREEEAEMKKKMLSDENICNELLKIFGFNKDENKTL